MSAKVDAGQITTATAAAETHTPAQCVASKPSSLARFLAWSIDLAISGVLAVALSTLLGNGFQDIFFGPIACYAIASIFYSTISLTSKSQATFGKKLFKLKVISSDGTRPSLGEAAVRDLCKTASLWTMGFTYAWPTFNKSGLSIHDWASNTRVAREGEIRGGTVAHSKKKHGTKPFKIGFILVNALFCLVMANAVVNVVSGRNKVSTAYESFKVNRSEALLSFEKSGKYPEVMSAQGESDKFAKYIKGRGAFLMQVDVRNYSVKYLVQPKNANGDQWECTPLNHYSALMVPSECRGAQHSLMKIFNISR